MHPLTQGYVETGLSNKKDYSEIPRVHLEVEEQLEIGKNLVAEHICLINDDHRSYPLFDQQTADLGLDVIKDM